MEFITEQPAKNSTFKLTPSKSTQVRSDEYTESENSITQKMNSRVLNGVRPKILSMTAINSKLGSMDEQSPLLPQFKPRNYSSQFHSAPWTNKVDETVEEEKPAAKSLTCSKLVISRLNAPGPFKANLCAPVLAKTDQPGRSSEEKKPVLQLIQDSDSSEDEFLSPVKHKRRDSISHLCSRNYSMNRDLFLQSEMEESSDSYHGAVCLEEARGFEQRIKSVADPKLGERHLERPSGDSQDTPSEESAINDHKEIETNEDIDGLLQQVPELIAFRERKRQEYLLLCAHQKRISMMRASGNGTDMLKYSKMG
jgi:hypothetical protein